MEQKRLYRTEGNDKEEQKSDQEAEKDGARQVRVLGEHAVNSRSRIQNNPNLVVNVAEIDSQLYTYQRTLRYYPRGEEARSRSLLREWFAYFRIRNHYRRCNWWG